MVTNINLHLLYSLIRSRTSIYLLNSIANNASNIDVYVCFIAGRTILAKTDQVKTEMGLVTKQTNFYQNINLYLLYSLIRTRVNFYIKDTSRFFYKIYVFL